MSRRYVKKVAYVMAAVCLTAALSVVLIEQFLSRRIGYRNPEFILAQRARMISQYGAQELTLTTPDGKKIAALYVARQHAKRLFLICHGYKHTKETMAPYLELFPHDSLFFIDFRGHGQSSGKRVSLGLHEQLDVLTAAAYIKEHIGAKLPLIALGISMGGSAVLRAAALNGSAFAAIIADSAPSSFQDVVARVLQKRNIPYPLNQLSLAWYATLMRGSFLQSSYLNYAQKITCPVLIIHDTQDSLIEFHHAERLFAALRCPCKELWATTGIRHGRIFKQTPQQYANHIEQFLHACQI